LGADLFRRTDLKEPGKTFGMGTPQSPHTGLAKAPISGIEFERENSETAIQDRELAGQPVAARDIWAAVLAA
jgi:hypothetical protein